MTGMRKAVEEAIEILEEGSEAPDSESAMIHAINCALDVLRAALAAEQPAPSEPVVTERMVEAACIAYTAEGLRRLSQQGERASDIYAEMHAALVAALKARAE